VILTLDVMRWFGMAKTIQVTTFPPAFTFIALLPAPSKTGKSWL
jgi:hypothetical protein